MYHSTPRPTFNAARASLAAIVVLVLIVGACSTNKKSDQSESANTTPTLDDGGTPKPGGVAIWGLEAETDGLDPISGRWAMSGHMMASAIFDPLVDVDTQGNWQPFLAQSLTPSGDFRTWTITLRSGVKFHDGTDLTGDAVAKALELQRSSAMTGAALKTVSGVKATGPLTVEVDMSEPWAAFPYTLATQVGYIPAPAMLGDVSKYRTPIGTGPFVFQSWDYEHRFRASRNPNYWRKDDQGNQLPYLDAIEFRPIADPQSRTDALVNGDVDAISTVSSNEIGRLKDASGIKTLTYDKGEKQFVMLNSGHPPFDNPNARLAAQYAIDAQTIRTEVGNGLAAVADQIWSPGELGHRDDPGYLGFDLAKARDHADKYKAETGKALSFTYTVDETSDVRASQLLKGMWEAAGIAVDVKTVSQADNTVLAALGNYQAIDWRFFGAADPDVEYVWLTSKSIDPNLISLNFAQFANPAIDSALDRGRSTTDRTARDDAYAEVARVLNSNAPYIWLYRVTWAIASNQTLHGYSGSLNGSIQSLGPKTWVGTLWKG